MSNLITDFETLCSAYEIPKNYATFSALGLLGACFNRRIFCFNGDVPVHSNLYTCLVGDQSNKKSTPNDFARDIFREVYPEIPIAPSVQSREDVIKFMASDADKFYYRDHEGVEIEYHPYMFFVNELDMFISINPAGMVSFLVDVYDRKFYDASTIKRGMEKFPNPAVNFMSCCTATWLIDRLRGTIISGGFFRRLIVINEDCAKDSTGKPLAIPRPELVIAANPDILKARHRIVDGLKASMHVAGVYKFTRLGGLYFDEWYIQNKQDLPDDPMLRGYLSSKDVQLRKVAMLIDVANPKPTFELSDTLLQVAKATLDSIEANLPRLSIAVSRNDLAVPQQEMLNLLKAKGGVMTEKAWLVEANKKMNDIEYCSMMRFLKITMKAYAVRVDGPNGHTKTVILDSAKMLEEQEKLGK